MSFRLELDLGNGAPKYYAVSCRYCEGIASFPIDLYPTFPAAFERAIQIGWDAEQKISGPIRYSCPNCTRSKEQQCIMKIAKIENECQPAGTEMYFPQEAPPKGWKLIGQKPAHEIPKAAKGTIVIQCRKER